MAAALCAVGLGAHDSGRAVGYAAADQLRSNMYAAADAAETRAAAADAERAALGYTWPNPTPVEDLPEYVDGELARQAERVGLPFVYQGRDEDVPGRIYLRMPDGHVYVAGRLNTADTGKLMGTNWEAFGCAVSGGPR